MKPAPRWSSIAPPAALESFMLPSSYLPAKPRQPDPDLWPHRSALSVSPGGSLTYAHPFSMWLLEGALFGAWFLPFSIHGAVCNKDICNKIPQNEKKKKNEANIMFYHELKRVWVNWLSSILRKCLHIYFVTSVLEVWLVFVLFNGWYIWVCPCLENSLFKLCWLEIWLGQDGGAC